MNSALLESPYLVSADELVAEAYRVMAPPPKLTVSEWADAKRKLGGKTNAEPGDWRTDRNPPLREIMNCCSDPYVREVTFMKAAQVGGTEGLVNNTIGYFMDQDPSPMLAVFENEKKMEAWSIERFMPMVIDTPCLRDKIRTDKGPSSGNKIAYKDFPGGFLAIANAGSEGDLSSRPVRIVLKDEIDKWKTLKAGDPDPLADKRTTTFLTRKKIINLSTPRDHHPPEIISRIYQKYESSDKRKYYVPCPFCGHEQTLRRGQLKFTRPGNSGDVVTDVQYECEKCKMLISHMHKRRMLEKGHWIPERPFSGHAGFYLNALYSPWVSWKEYIEAFLRMKRQRDTYKTFVNEWDAEPWNPELEVDKDISPYLSRREHYDKVPVGAGLLTAAVDVQADRLEVEVKAWGIGRESWGMDHKIFWGDPRKLSTGYLPQVWIDLDIYLQKSWEHECGVMLPLSRVFIDMGYCQAEVIKFCRGKRSRGVWPSKGMSTAGAILVTKRPSKTKDGSRYFPIGPNAAKDIVFSNMDSDPPKDGETCAPGYMHFNQNYDEEYFKQLLLSERPKYLKGAKVYEKISQSSRNEAVDLNVGNLAAYESMAVDPKPYVEALVRKAKSKTEKDTEQKPESKIQGNIAAHSLRRRTLSRGIE